MWDALAARAELGVLLLLRISDDVQMWPCVCVRQYVPFPWMLLWRQRIGFTKLGEQVAGSDSRPESEIDKRVECNY